MNEHKQNKLKQQNKLTKKLTFFFEENNLVTSNKGEKRQINNLLEKGLKLKQRKDM